MRISDWSSDVCSSDLRSIPWTIATARIRDRFTLRSGRHHFFDCRSFNPALPQHRVREQPFESRVLLLKRAQPLRLRYLQATELGLPRIIGREIGRASCRERGCQYVQIPVVAVSLKKKYVINSH